MRHQAPVGAAFAFLAMAVASPPPVALAQVHVHYVRTQQSQEPAPSGQLAPRLQNLGNHTFPVTTKSEQAQTFINQASTCMASTTRKPAGPSAKPPGSIELRHGLLPLVLGPNINMLMDQRRGAGA
jgi:hypothetical protein